MWMWKCCLVKALYLLLQLILLMCFIYIRTIWWFFTNVSFCSSFFFCHFACMHIKNARIHSLLILLLKFAACAFFAVINFHIHIVHKTIIGWCHSQCLLGDGIVWFLHSCNSVEFSHKFSKATKWIYFVKNGRERERMKWWEVKKEHFHPFSGKLARCFAVVVFFI